MYKPPLEDILFNLDRMIGLQMIAGLKGFEAVSDDLVASVLDEAGKLAAETFAPLNHSGDKEGLKFSAGRVTMPKGFRQAYQLYVDGGWNGLCFPEAAGGQGLPFSLAMPVQEMLQTANLSLALCTLLNQGAIELLLAHGSEAQKAKYIPQMMTGAWTGTMNLTEPQAGSDVGAVACKARKDGAHYRITGQKIFISYGGHDMAENIIHLVLARLPDAPAGTKGLSLFLVPQKMVKDDGTLGEDNDVRVVSLEHKLGQHASPTCTMAYGDKGGAYGELVGREGGGIEAMFVMMNNARIGVGVQGLALCECALQGAASYARTRIQSKPLVKGIDKPVAIIHHPDVRRMLMTMKAQTEAARSLAYSAALAIDVAHAGNDEAARKAAQIRVDLLTPLVKGWITDLANEITSLGVQVFGGMGYVEETGAAQHMRDARVLAIYEGTNGIQAADLVFRKLARDEGAALKAYLAECRAMADTLKKETGDDAAALAGALKLSLQHAEKAAEHILKTLKQDVNVAAFASAPFLRLLSTTAGGAMMAKAMQLALTDMKKPGTFSPAFLESKIITARFYGESILPQTAGLLTTIEASQRGVLTLPEAAF